MSRANGRIRIKFETQREASAIGNALKPEAEHPAGERARATIIVRGKQVCVNLNARDSSSLRAVMTSYLRMLSAARNVLLEVNRPQMPPKRDKNH